MSITTRVFYEWDIESFDVETGDIIDHNHSDKCPGIPDEPGLRLVLVRDTALCDDGEAFDLDKREWAYVENGQLPENFCIANKGDGSRVPQRFHDELRRKLLEVLPC